MDQPSGRASGQTDGDAKEKLLAVAGPMFADRGYDGVSTRDLSRKAKVNLSAITYHFGSKRGLYNAVIERIVADIAPMRTFLVDTIDGGVARAADDSDALPDVVEQFVRMMVTFLTHPDFQYWRMQLIMREITQPTDAFETIMNRHIGPIQSAIGRIVALATGRPEEDERTILLTSAIMSQLLQFGFARNLMLNRLQWPAFTPERVETAIAVTVGIVFSMLGLDGCREIHA